MVHCDRKGLTQREKDVLAILIKGMSNKEIAATLHISEKTVETHLRHIYDKLDVSRRMEILLRHFNNQGTAILNLIVFGC